MLLLLVGQRIGALSDRFARLHRWSGWFGLGLVLATMVAPKPQAFPWARATVAVFGTMLLIGLPTVERPDRLRPLLASPVARWIGHRSYALYLWHWPVYVLARERGEVIGCWRLLPTVGPNMLRDVFPELLAGAPAPCAADTWELSRFAVREGASDAAGFGLSDLPLRMLEVALGFARDQGIARFVSVTSVAIERMFRKQGIEVERLGPAIRIGRVTTVACAMETFDVPCLPKEPPPRMPLVAIRA